MEAAGVPLDASWAEINFAGPVGLIGFERSSGNLDLRDTGGTGGGGRECLVFKKPNENPCRQA